MFCVSDLTQNLQVPGVSGSRGSPHCVPPALEEAGGLPSDPARTRDWRQRLDSSLRVVLMSPPCPATSIHTPGHHGPQQPLGLWGRRKGGAPGPLTLFLSRSGIRVRGRRGREGSCMWLPAGRELRGLKGDTCRQQPGSGSVEMLAERSERRPGLRGDAFAPQAVASTQWPPQSRSGKGCSPAITAGASAGVGRGDLGSSCGLDTAQGPVGRGLGGLRAAQGPGRSAAPKTNGCRPSASA